jgi:hypothetical protein
MNAICRWGLQFGLTFAAMLLASFAPTSVLAYTPEQQQACTPDAMRLCGNFVPDVDRITACMIQNKSQLSPECRRFFRAGPEPGEAAGPPTDIRPAAQKAAPARPASTKKRLAKPADT